MLVDRFTKPLPKQPAPNSFAIAKPRFVNPRAAANGLTITWVGHSTLLIQMGGMNILTDPVWSSVASPVSFLGPRRWVPPAIEFDELPPIDVVLMSHNHYDHCDVPTIRRLTARYPDISWFAPLGVAALLQRHGAQRVAELDWWQEATLGASQFACTPAQHFSARGLLDRDRTLWCGWAIRSAHAKVLFAGDTALHPEYGRIAAEYGPFDVVAIPIGAYEPRWFMRPVHMNPDDALKAYRALNGTSSAPAFVPIHWGTFKLTDEAMDEPPRRLRAGWTEAGYDEHRLWILNHGETRAR